jgi:enterochelin esterase family protein
VLAIHRLEREETGDGRAIDAFLESNDFPLVEGTTVTFIYRGEADAVALRHWIAGLASAQPFVRMGETDLWYLSMDLPRGSRVEYKLELVRDGEKTWIQDPLNDAIAHDPYGFNSVAHADGYEVPEWTQPDPEARPGELVDHDIESRAFGETRTVRVYLPARFRETRAYPLLIVHDGDDYLRYSGLRTVLDNLIHRGEVPPLVAALTTSPDRLTEYPNHAPHATFLKEELVPELEAKLPLIERPDSRGLMGASFGAVASLSTAWRHPGFFGNLLLQSGSFVFTDIGEHRHGPTFDPVVRFMNEFREAPGRPAERLALTCGMYEEMIYYNRSVVPRLQATGMAMRYKEARDGHNWENWRDQLRGALSWLFPGPLWMVYE